MSVILAGTGCGNTDTMTCEVRRAIEEADVLIGAERLLESIPADSDSLPESMEEQLPASSAAQLPASNAERIPAIYAQEICDLIREHLIRNPGQNICVLYSGDSGFYSGTRSVLPLLEEAGIEVKVLPGISSVQVFSARLRRPWQDWVLVSAHGTDCDAVTAVMQGKPVFFLTGGKLTPKELCGQLTKAGLADLEITIGERLTYSDERIARGTAGEFAAGEFAPLSVMLAEPAESAGDLTPGIADEEFIRGDVPMTKETVRAAILGHLQVRKGDTVWDVGAGTGSVSVELAMKAAGGRVYAVEREPEGCELIRVNRKKFGVWNLCPVDGSAPEALAGLPTPDKVFIGGSDGHLQEIIGIAMEKNPTARICVSAIVLETMQEAVEVMSRAGMNVKIVQVAVSTARAIGKTRKRHMLMAGNPIFIVTGESVE